MVEGPGKSGEGKEGAMQMTKEPSSGVVSSAEESRGRPQREAKAIVHRRRFARPVAPGLAVLPPLALILVGLAPVLLAVAGLALVVVCLLPLALAVMWQPRRAKYRAFSPVP